MLREDIKYITDLVAKTYSAQNKNKVSKHVKKMLELRAWVIHSVLTAIRMILMLFSLTSWQRSLHNRDTTIHNTELINNITYIIQLSIIVTTIIGFVLDIACCKYIKIAHVLIYVEIVYTCLIAMVPYEAGLGASQTVLIMSTFSALCLYCDPIPNFAFMILLVIWLAFFQIPLVWD